MSWRNDSQQRGDMATPSLGENSPDWDVVNWFFSHLLLIHIYIYIYIYIYTHTHTHTQKEVRTREEILNEFAYFYYFQAAKYNVVVVFCVSKQILGTVSRLKLVVIYLLKHFVVIVIISCSETFSPNKKGM